MAKAGGRTAWRRRVLARGVDDTAASASASLPGGGAASRRRDDRLRGDDGPQAGGGHRRVGRRGHRRPAFPPLRADRAAAPGRAPGGRVAGRRASCWASTSRTCRFLGFEEHTLERCLRRAGRRAGRRGRRAGARRGAGHVGARLEPRSPGGAPGGAPGPGPSGSFPRRGRAPTRCGSGPTGPGTRPRGNRSAPSCGSCRTDPLAARHLPAARLVSTAGFTELKRAAFALHASQTTNLTGEAGWQVFPERWIEPFLGPWELAFPVDLSAEPVATPLAVGRGGSGSRAAAPSPAGEPALTQLRDDFDDDRPAGRRGRDDGHVGGRRAWASTSRPRSGSTTASCAWRRCGSPASAARDWPTGPSDGPRG